ncbi:MAG: hypothetical protein KJO15_12170 [Alphaproteobacteria bacterium]|nr:hypothetical protein [Alphaproteobacteria bacterium]
MACTNDPLTALIGKLPDAHGTLGHYLIVPATKPTELSITWSEEQADGPMAAVIMVAVAILRNPVLALGPVLPRLCFGSL